MSETTEHTGWLWMTETATIHQGACYLWGWSMIGSAGGAQINIYDGLDADSGRQVVIFEGANNISNTCMLPKKILLTSGLRIDLNTNVDGVLVLYEPLME